MEYQSKSFIIIISIIIILTIISTYLLFFKRCINKGHHEHIKTLLRQSARYSIAALQDKSLFIAVLHANYGAGYWWALKDIYPSNIISSVAGVSSEIIEKEILDIQDYFTRQLIRECSGIRTGFTPAELSKYAELIQLAGYI